MKETQLDFPAAFLDEDLKRHSLRGGTATMLAQGCKFILQLGATIILARLLTPEDYGLFTIVITVIAFVSLFKDMGISMAVISSPTLDQKQANALFWISVLLGVVLALVTAAFAPLIAWLFHEPRLASMILVMAVTFVLYGFSNQPMAWLSRQMRFLASAAIQVSALGLGILLGIASAWFGMGYWSLVLIQVGLTLFQAVGLIIAVRGIPSLPERVSIRPFLSVGGNLTGVNILGYLNRNVDNALIGWLRGARELGFYDKAYQLILLPILQVNIPLSTIAISALSRLQSELPRYRIYFEHIILILASLGMPLIAFLFVTADQMVLLALGDGWNGTVPLFRALAPAAFVDTFASAINWMFVSLNQTRRQLRSAIAVSAVTVAALILGAPWGALGIAIGFSLARVGVILPHLVYACQKSPVRWTGVMKILARPAFASLGAAVLLFFINERFLTLTSLFLNALSAGTIYAALYLALWVSVPGGGKRLRDIIRWTKSLVQGVPLLDGRSVAK